MATAKGLRLSIRLTPYQAERLADLRALAIADGEKPRSATEMVVRSILLAHRRADEVEADIAREKALLRTAAALDEGGGP